MIATDASEKQIAKAEPHERVEYRVAPAENSRIEPATVDLIMVAQALHWFDLERFYAEARRVLKSDGVLAASAYNLLRIEPVIDEVVNRYYYEVVGPFWPPERKLVEQFDNLPFPFHEIRSAEIRDDSAVEFRSSGRLPSNVVINSAVHRCKRHRSVETDNAELRAAWGSSERTRNIIWPLILRIGRKQGIAVPVRRLQR